MDIRYIYKRWQHHSAHSGYDQLANFGGDHLPVIDFADRRKRIVPWRLANLFVGPRSGIQNYLHESFYTELSAAFAMRKSRAALFHFLYGDYDYRYTGWLNGMRGNRVVASFHLPPAQAAKLIKVHRHYDQLSAVVVVGKNQIPYFQQYVDGKKIHYVPHGVDIQYFAPGSRQNRAEVKHVLFVGRHLRDINVFKEVVRRLQNSSRQITFTVVGGDEHIQKSVAGVEGVRFLSGISEAELVQLYQTAHLLLLPLIDATANNTLLEAIACGLPTVVTDVGGIRDYVDERCAALVQPGDAQQMYESACELLENNRYNEDLSIASRDRALEFSWEIVAAKMFGIYEALLAAA